MKRGRQNGHVNGIERNHTVAAKFSEIEKARLDALTDHFECDQSVLLRMLVKEKYESVLRERNRENEREVRTRLTAKRLGE